jgi:hypothetical protein
MILTSAFRNFRDQRKMRGSLSPKRFFARPWSQPGVGVATRILLSQRRDPQPRLTTNFQEWEESATRRPGHVECERGESVGRGTRFRLGS